ncbi:MAG: hypothetical protein AAGE59_09495 [Cyanobacteria bacterium P01_F01_bin.86]
MDNVYWFLPNLSQFSTILSGGEIPLFGSTGFEPFYNNPFYSFSYPFYFTFLDIYSSAADALNNFHKVKLLHFLLCFYAVFYCAVAFGVKKHFALFVASIFTMSTFLSVMASWAHNMFSFVWMILSIALIKLLLDSKHISNLLLAGIVFSLVMMMLAGPAASLRFFLYVALVLLVTHYNALLHIARAPLNLLKMSIALIALVLMTAHAILPFIADIEHFIRWVTIDGKLTSVDADLKIPYESTLLKASEFKDFNHFVQILANAKGPTSYFLGIPVVALAITYVVTKGIRSWNAGDFALLLLMLWSVGSIFGETFYISIFNYHLPGLSGLRHPWMFSYIAILSIAVFAGLGLQSLVEKNASIIIFLGLIVVSFSLLFGLDKDYLSTKVFILSLITVTLLVVAVTLSRYPIRGYSLSLVTALIVIVSCINSVMQKHHHLSSPEDVKRALTSKTDIQEINNILSTINSIEKASPSRVAFVIDSQRRIPVQAVENLSAYYSNINSLRRYGSPAMEDLFRTYNYKFRFPGFYEFNGARYIVSDKKDQYANPCYKMIQSLDFYNLYESCHYRQEFYLAREIRTYKHPPHLLKLIPTLGNENVAILRDDAEKTKGHNPNQSGSNLKIITNRMNTKVLEVEMTAKGILVFNSYYNNNWQLQINGEQSEFFKINGNQIGVLLGAGQSVVSFSFEPRFYLTLIKIASATALLFALFCMYQIVMSLKAGRARAV